MTPSTHQRYDRSKRAADFLLSLALLILTAPVQAVVAIAVRWRIGSPVIFRQRRPGRHGEPFTLLKFRTMHPVDAAVGELDDASRMTLFGARLRASSLDELPSLWCVLRGDMSVVGPRPLLMSYLERYSAEQARRHEVRPGVTGLAQVSGRNALDWADRLALDIRYVDHRCWRLDLTILARTVTSVLRRSGISAPGSVTMPQFTGTSCEAEGGTSTMTVPLEQRAGSL